MHSNESRFLLYDYLIYCLQACVCVCVCTFQPGNFTGWGSEGVKGGPKEVLLVRVSLYILPAFMGFTGFHCTYYQFPWVSQGFAGDNISFQSVQCSSGFIQGKCG